MQIETTIKEALVQYNDIAPQGKKADEYIAEYINQVKDYTIADVQDKKGYELVRRARLDAGKIRVAIEKKGKELRADATAYSKAVIAEEKRLVSLISPVEDQLYAQEEAYANALKAIEEEKQRQRMIVMQSRVAQLTELGLVLSDGWYQRDHLTIKAETLADISEGDIQDFLNKAAAYDAEKRPEEEKRMTFVARQHQLVSLGYIDNPGKNEFVRKGHNIGLNWIRDTTEEEWSKCITEIENVRHIERIEADRREKESEEARQKEEMQRKDDLRSARQMVIDNLPEEVKAYLVASSRPHDDIADFSHEGFNIWIERCRKEAAEIVEDVTADVMEVDYEEPEEAVAETIATKKVRKHTVGEEFCGLVLGNRPQYANAVKDFLEEEKRQMIEFTRDYVNNYDLDVTPEDYWEQVYGDKVHDPYLPGAE